MAGKVTTLYEDSAKTNALYPRTKASAVSDSNNNTLTEVGFYTAETVGSGVDPVKVSLDMDLLWTNSSPTSAFAAQTISLDLSDYRCFIVYIRHYTNDNSVSSAFLVKSDIVTMLTAYGQTGNWACRYITSITDSGVIFGNGKASNGSVNDQAGIPYKIYGIR